MLCINSGGEKITPGGNTCVDSWVTFAWQETLGQIDSQFLNLEANILSEHMIDKFERQSVALSPSRLALVLYWQHIKNAHQQGNPKMLVVRFPLLCSDVLEHISGGGVCSEWKPLSPSLSSAKKKKKYWVAVCSRMWIESEPRWWKQRSPSRKELTTTAQRPFNRYNGRNLLRSTGIK